MSNFISYKGDDLNGLPVNENHIVYKWNTDLCHILFSITRKGNALSLHFSSDKTGLRYIKKAIDEFCKFCFRNYEWCEMMIAQITRPSVLRITKPLNFEYICTNNSGVHIYIRRRP